MELVNNLPPVSKELSTVYICVPGMTYVGSLILKHFHMNNCDGRSGYVHKNILLVYKSIFYVNKM